jgi:hypothetical protein
LAINTIANIVCYNNSILTGYDHIFKKVQNLKPDLVSQKIFF